MILTKKNRHTTSYFGKADGKKGFFGRLWNTIKSAVKNNIGTIAGGLIGGPIGLLFGAAIDAFIQGLGNDIPGMSRVIGSGSFTGNDEYPVTKREEGALLFFLNVQLLPSLVVIANKIDEKIVAIASKGTNTNEIVLNNINEGLKKIAAARAYAILLENDKINTLSENFIINKVEMINYYFDSLEKAIIKYAQDNFGETHKLVLESTTVSTFKKIEKIEPNWNGKTITANANKYIAKSAQPTNNQTPVTVVDTDVTSSAPVIDPVSNDTANTIEATPKKYGLLKKAAIGTGIALVIKQLIK